MPKESSYSAYRRDGNYSVVRTTANQATVEAAGALIWRRKNRKLELLIIHRPRYDDWSWPKGKVDEGETITETAIREIQEEVGLDVVLGVPLAVTSYKVPQGSKNVFYWAAEVSLNAKPKADMGEVDELRWVSPDQAEKLLTNSSDKLPLQALVELEKEGDLSTRPVLIVRHAKAKPRASWAGPEGERPLAATGKRQALAVCQLLEAWKPAKVISSPWTRCMQTVANYIKDNEATIRTKSQITEASHKRHPKKAAKVIESLFDKDYPVALCTHRPVLPTVLEVIGGHMNKALTKHLPLKDPHLQTGEIMVLQVSQAQPDRVVSYEQIKPFGD